MPNNDQAKNEVIAKKNAIPFEIQGVPSPFVTMIFALIVFSILLIILNLKESIAYIKGKFNFLFPKQKGKLQMSKS